MTFHLVPVAPFRLDLTAWTLRRRLRNRVDRWDGATYRRAVATDRGIVELAVRQVGGSRAPRVRVDAVGAVTDTARRTATATLERALGLRVDLRPFYRMAARDARLGPLAGAFRGAKPPRFPTVFEAIVNAIACQQLSLTVGLEMLNRLAAACAGVRGDRNPNAFPRPRDVARLPAASIEALGFSRQKTRALQELAHRVTAAELDLERLATLDNRAAVQQLMAIRGIGRWSAEYVLLRGLGRLDVFPGDDVGARNRLAKWLGRRRSLDYQDVHRAVAAWQPYAGLVYFHMLLAGLRESGDLRIGRTDDSAAPHGSRRPASSA